MRGEAKGLQSKERRIVIKWEKVCTFLSGFAKKTNPIQKFIS
jgi:hypothetical protein